MLKDNKVDVMVSYLPVGSEEADKFYAQCAIDAGVAFVNALPVFIASDPVWAKKFEDAGVPIVGDDIKSQVGATITHRVMAKLFEDRGVQLDRTMQLNVGGNMDFLNMLERERLESKKISKTQAVTSNLQREFNTKDVHIGPSDHVGWLDDRKWAYVRLEGRAFGDVPLNLEYKLEVWDSPNSAGVIIDAVRAAKIAKDRGIGGPVVAASAYLMKSPPKQLPDDIARDAARGRSSRADPLLPKPTFGRESASRSRHFVDLGGGLKAVAELGWDVGGKRRVQLSNRARVVAPQAVRRCEGRGAMATHVQAAEHRQVGVHIGRGICLDAPRLAVVHIERISAATTQHVVRKLEHHRHIGGVTARLQHRGYVEDPQPQSVVDADGPHQAWIGQQVRQHIVGIRPDGHRLDEVHTEQNAPQRDMRLRCDRSQLFDLDSLLLLVSVRPIQHIAVGDAGDRSKRCRHP